MGGVGGLGWEEELWGPHSGSLFVSQFLSLSWYFCSGVYVFLSLLDTNSAVSLTEMAEKREKGGKWVKDG